MIPLIFVFKSKINVCSESKKFKFFLFQQYDETFGSRKLSHNETQNDTDKANFRCTADKKYIFVLEWYRICQNRVFW